MDTFDFFGNVKTQKAKDMRKNNIFNSITRTLRILELCVSLLLLYWILTHLSFAVQISRAYFRKISSFIGSHLFVFIIYNAIIATLVVDSRRIIDQNSDGDNVETELYRELSKKCADRTESQSASEIDTDHQSRVAEEVEYQDKQKIPDIDTTAPQPEDRAESNTCMDSDPDAEPKFDIPKFYRRSRSENLAGGSRKVARRELWRSETEKCRETAKAGENAGENLNPREKLSNEEFQRMIEAFIAKQMRSLREESLAIVV